MEPPLDALQQRLGHRFGNAGLLQRALTHRSFGSPHNERLEFLGDAALNLAISVLLVRRFGQADEGELTRMRAHLVREDSLHQVAVTLGLQGLLRMSDGEHRGGGAQRASILADALEALIGAVTLDAGFAAAQGVVEGLFGLGIAASEIGQYRKDAKTELQEWLQARRMPVPAYRIVATTGQAHEQTFEVACEVAPLGLACAGHGRSRRVAEQEAARLVLERVKEKAP